ncbi:MAG: TRAP transporter small permease subunit [Pseudomonadota bacterium]
MSLNVADTPTGATSHGGGGRDMTKFITRGFGWAMLTFFVAWMINALMTLSFGWPGALTFLTGENSLASSFQFALFPLAIGLAFGWVYCTEQVTLRQDAARVSNLNEFLIRWAFFAVLLVGIADMTISFLRVEGLLSFFVGDQMTSDLGRSAYRGPWVHIPLAIVALFIAMRSRSLGFHWLTLLIVIAELAIVITRFIFSYEQAFMGDLVRYWYAALFLFGSAYTLLEDGHVRVDVFYAGMKNTTKGFVNAVGTLFLGITLCWVIIVLSLGGRNAIVYGSVANFETSQSGFGMYVKYQMALFLAIFAVTMLIQFVSYLMESVADYRGEDGTRLDREVAVH